MRWTIWQRRTLCSNCGARMSVPESGWTMRCEFCNSEQAVPDIEERRKKLRVSVQKTHDPSERRRLEAELQRAQVVSDSYARAAGAVSGAVRGLMSVAVLLLLIAGALFFTGWWERLDNYWRGDTGNARYEESAERLRQVGYRVTRMRQEARALLKPGRLYLELDAKSCYGLVVASGQPVAEVLLQNARGKTVKTDNTMRFSATLVYCPRRAGVFTARVKLAEPGRYCWGLYKKPRPGDGAAHDEAAPRRPKRRKSKVGPKKAREEAPAKVPPKAPPPAAKADLPPDLPPPKDKVGSVPEIPETPDDDL